jgi:Glycosyl transferase family 2.
LIDELSDACKCFDFETDIIAFEDGSTIVYDENRTSVEKSNGKYIVSSENLGRSKSRNILAQNARYEYLVFIDCDSKVLDGKEYISTYIDFINRFKEIGFNKGFVLCGGRYYMESNDICSDYHLHKHIGYIREPNTYLLNDKANITIDKRKSDKGYYVITDPDYLDADKINHYSMKLLLSNNFLIRKEDFEKVRFDERITKYGHEDTLLGIELRKRDIEIFYIKNPVLHMGLKNNDEFISDLKKSIDNLKFISENVIDDISANDFKLLRYYRIIKRLKLSKTLNLIYVHWGTKIESSLKTKNIRICLCWTYTNSDIYAI